MVSDVSALLNGVFIRPKRGRRPTMLIAGRALVMTAAWDEVRKQTWGALLVGR